MALRLIVWLGCVSLGLAFEAQAQSTNGTLRVVKGDVKVKSGKSGEITKGRIGSQVFPKDTVITGPDSRAKIVMVDNNEINVSPDSQIEIQQYDFDPAKGKKDVLLNVIYGKVRSKVEQKYDGKTSKFLIKTPAAVAGVRGTDFMTSFDRQSSQSQIVTFEGKVEFGTQGPNGTIANAVFVAPGQMATAAQGQAPSAPVEVPKQELSKMEKETKAEPSSGPAPASEGGAQPVPDKKGDGKSSESKGEPNADAKPAAPAAGADKKSAGAPPAPPAESGERAPASAAGPAPTSGSQPPPPPGGSMLLPQDMAGNADAPSMPAVGLAPINPVGTMPGNMLPTTTAPTDLIQNIIQNNTVNSTLNVIVTPGP